MLFCGVYRRRAPLLSDRSALTPRTLAPKTFASKTWAPKAGRAALFKARGAAAHGHLSASFWRGLLVAPGGGSGAALQVCLRTNPRAPHPVPRSRRLMSAPLYRTR